MVAALRSHGSPTTFHMPYSMNSLPCYDSGCPHPSRRSTCRHPKSTLHPCTYRDQRWWWCNSQTGTLMNRDCAAPKFRRAPYPGYFHRYRDSEPRHCCSSTALRNCRACHVIPRPADSASISSETQRSSRRVFRNSPPGCLNALQSKPCP